MKARQPSLSLVVVLVAGLAIGWGLANARPASVLAVSADRWGERALVAGPIGMEILSEKVTVPQDALYYLNYSTGKLLATIPTYQAGRGNAQVLSEFVERDLIADFGIQPGQNPHFLMTTGSLGMNGAGWSPLFVFETESGQVATYKVAPQQTPGSTRPRFDLIDRRVDRRLGRSIAPASH